MTTCAVLEFGSYNVMPRVFLGIPVDISTMCGSEVPCQERFQSLQDIDWLKMHFAA